MKKFMDFNTPLSTKYVSHFTKKFETLCKIISEGFKPNPNKERAIGEEDTDIQKALLSLFDTTDSSEEEKYCDIPMVCFCDIPKKLIKQHAKKYGPYCIGLTKEWGIKHTSPVIYIPQNSTLHALINAILILIKRIFAEAKSFDSTPLHEKINRLCAFIKPYMNESGNEKYYDEREWRYVPDPELPESNLPFKKEDICFIMVQTAKEKKELKKLLQEKFGDCGHIKILFSKKLHC
jgi:hypothetical protein